MRLRLRGHEYGREAGGRHAQMAQRGWGRHDAHAPISCPAKGRGIRIAPSLPIATPASSPAIALQLRSEEHTSELQSLMRNSYAVFCWKKKRERKTIVDEQK